MVGHNLVKYLLDMLLIRMFAESGNMPNSLSWSKNGNWVLLLSKDDSIGYRERKTEEKVDTIRGGKTILRTGQGKTLLAH